MELKEKKVSIGLLCAIIAIPVFEILRVPLGLFFEVIGIVANAVLVNPFMWFIDRGIIGAFWSYQIPILPYAVAIIFKVIAIPVVFIVLLLALIIGFIILVLSLLLIWLDEIHILAWIIGPIFAYYAYMTDFWADQREEIRDRLLQIRAVLVNIVSWFASLRAIKVKLDDGKTVSYKIKRKYSKTVLALAIIFISIGMIGRSTEFFFIQRRSHTLSYKSSSYLYVNADVLNVRTQPNLANSSSIIAVAKKGQRLEKLGEQGSWYKVRLPDNKIGWVYRDYVFGKKIINKTIVIKGSTPFWTETDIFLLKGDVVNFKASGRIIWDPKVPEPEVSPKGASWTPSRGVTKPQEFLLPDFACAGLIGKIGEDLFGIGIEKRVEVKENGMLYIGINERWREECWNDNKGEFQVDVQVERIL